MTLAGRLPPVVESAAYFVVAEALANAGKYSNATRIEIAVRQAAEQLELEVTDDGRGGANPEGGGPERTATAGGGARRTPDGHEPRGRPDHDPAELPCGS